MGEKKLPIQNIPIRTELGRQIRKAFRERGSQTDADLPCVYEMTNTAHDGTGEWVVEGSGLEPMYIYFADKRAAEIVVRALNQAYATGHAFGRTAGK